MKRILLTTVSLGVLGLMSPALGADLPLYSKAPVVATPVYDWSGFYVGVFGGGVSAITTRQRDWVRRVWPISPATTIRPVALVAAKSATNGRAATLCWRRSGRFRLDIKGSDISPLNAGTLPIGSTTRPSFVTGRYVPGARRHRGRSAAAVLHRRLGLMATASTPTPIRASWGRSVHGEPQWARRRRRHRLRDHRQLIGKFEYRYYDYGTYTA